MSQQDQKHFNRYFPQRPILYQAGFAIIFDSTTAAIMLSQLLYWHGKGRNKHGWVYKTIEDMKKETGLTRYQQETARRILESQEVLEYKLAGIPAKRHFRVNIKKLEEKIPSLMESHKLHYLVPTNIRVGQPQSITKSTLENTSKITSNTAFLKRRKELGNARSLPP